MTTRHLATAIALGLGLTLALFLVPLLSRGAGVNLAPTSPGIRYVAPDGEDGGECDTVADRCRTVQWALDVAEPLDEIRVAAGVYTDPAGTVAEIRETVTLLGGWDSGFTIRDPGARVTTLDAQRRGRVVFVRTDSSATIDGFTITGGNATAEPLLVGRGGGIASRYADPIIQNNLIISNSASISPTSGGGGGIYLLEASATALISGNRILSNTAYSASWSVAGGGLHLDRSEATVQGNLIAGNRCTRAGGGIFSEYGAARILNNEIRANRAGINGGGIYSRNLDRAVVQGNVVVDNAAAYHGGGICAAYGTTPTIVANHVLSNAGDQALALEGYGTYTVTNNVIAHSSAGGLFLWDATRFGLIAHNTIAANGSFGIRLDGGPMTPTIVNNVVALNAYGIQVEGFGPSGTLDYNDVWGNTIQDYDLPGPLQPGPHSLQADPRFVAGGGDDFHLGVGSPCIDTGTPVGVTTDVDGDVRPIGPRVDIGADEARRRVYLPLVVRDP
jgi:putative cofactor-binding repeat protein